MTQPMLETGWVAIRDLLNSPSWVEKSLVLLVAPILLLVGLLLLPHTLVIDLYLVVMSEADTMAAELEDQESRIRVSQAKRAPRPGVAKKGSLRCAYCHEDFGAGQTSTCSSCQTVLHTACAVELGGCPTLGCSKARNPRSQRA